MKRSVKSLLWQILAISIYLNFNHLCAEEQGEQGWVFQSAQQLSVNAELPQPLSSLPKAKSTQKKPLIQVYATRVRQKFEGMGASLTESSAFVLAHLSPKKRQEVIRSLFGREGAHFSMTRTHIGSCDFSVEGKYSYQVSEDSAFSLAEDKKGFGNLDQKTYGKYPKSAIKDTRYDLIPLLLEALAEQPQLKIISSAWSAPPWMTSISPDYNRSGYLNSSNQWVDGTGGYLTKGKSYSEYLIQYLDQYKKEGIPIWGITPINEPMGNNGSWESMNWSPEDQSRWIRSDLGPAMVDRGYHDLKVLAFDQNKAEMEPWAKAMFDNPETSKYTSGIGYHWYNSTVYTYSDVLDKIHDQYPEKMLIHTEGCIDDLGTEPNNMCYGKTEWTEKGWFNHPGWWWRQNATDWGYAVPWAADADHPKYAPVHRYVNNIMDDLNHWVQGWVDWNVILDHEGGPNHVGNYCGAPIMIDTSAQNPDQHIFYTPIYHLLSQFSRSLQPGDVILESSVDSKQKSDMPSRVKALASSRSSKEINVSLFNPSQQDQDVTLMLDSKPFRMSLLGESLTTITFHKEQL
jgi:glucosylceramidase